MASRLRVRMVALAVALVSLPQIVAAGPSAGSDRQILHILNRLAFGPTLDEFREVKAVGIDRWIDEQLHPENIAEPTALQQRLAGLETLRLDAMQLRQLYGPPPRVPGIKLPPEELKARRQRALYVLRQAQEGRLLRAVMSRRQLLEVMVNFWFNHFNIFAGKGLDRIWAGDYESRAIRPNALGHFRDLLLATAGHPAMLFYLDNWLNSAPGTQGPRNQHGINENYAREVMELHTLGAGGGYTQDDVIALARALTGWGLNPPNSAVFPAYAAIFQGRRHDYGPDVYLGRPLTAVGKAEGEEALDRLARSPATARHIGYELAQYFVADEPPPALVARLAARFTTTDGDIREVLKTLFASREFRDSIGVKYKTPYEFAVSAVRASGLPLRNVQPLRGILFRLGMPLYLCQTPDGYKNTRAAWLNPDATLQRINWAVALAHGALPIAGPPEQSSAPQIVPDAARPPPQDPVDANRLLAIFSSSLSGSTSKAIPAAPPDLRAALILGSPDFMTR
jgi:uncharacterized protein (DUF1800 family)